jgi:hypothetical protein
METLLQKRKQYHRILIELGEEKYKDVIVGATFPGKASTTELSETQLDVLIHDAKTRAGEHAYERRQPLSPTTNPEQSEIRRLRNKCLLVLAERGITATPKDWSAVNRELEADRYQWILTDRERAAGRKNKRGLIAFNTPESLRKLFKQLCSIRDNQQVIIKRIRETAAKN